MMPVGTRIIAWSHQFGARPGVVRGSMPHASGMRAYVVELDGQQNLWEITENWLFAADDIVAARSSLSPEIGTA